jgi:KinB signaling pathway activation protein
VKDFSIMEISSPGFSVETMAFILLGGATISMLSQMGFFSYLILRYLAMGMIRSRRLWDAIQVVIVVVAFADMVYLRFTGFAAAGESWAGYLVLPAVLLLVALGISYWKMKLTNAAGFVPTLFFMFVVTILEAVQALRLNSLPSYVYMLTPLLVCNAWQILILHKLLQNGGTAKSAPLT